MYIYQSLTDSGAVAARDGVFGMGVGTIALQNVSCAGSEGNFTQCTISRALTSCTHFQDAGVDCLGRPLRKLAVLVNFYLCVCMCIHCVSHAHAHTHTHTHTHTHAHTHTHTHAHAHTHTHMHTHTRVRTHTHTHLHMALWVHLYLVLVGLR